MKIVECIPNFSEGRDKKVVDEIAKEISLSGVKVLDVEMDPDHNRSVVTFVGEIKNVKDGAFRGVKKAAELIDLNVHRGGHPRIGACDVLPIVPITCSMEDCVKAARELGERIWGELSIPVYFYEEAALIPERRRLEVIRRGGYETLKDEVKTPGRRPDLGEDLHETAGAVVVGARKVLIAYNVYLNEGDEREAKRIAKKIRESSGGLKDVKAIGLTCGGRAQVSMNLIDYESTPIHRVLEEIERYGEIGESELIGLIPENAVLDASYHYLKLKIDESQILEKRLESLIFYRRVIDFMDDVASKKPAPGGGSAAALTGALAAALGEKASRISGFATQEFSRLRDELLSLSQEDGESFLRFIRSKPHEREDALKTAALVPAKTVELCRRVEDLCLELAKNCDEKVRSDAKCGLELAGASVSCARFNVEINLESISDKKFVKEIGERLR